MWHQVAALAGASGVALGESSTRLSLLHTLLCEHALLLYTCLVLGLLRVSIMYLAHNKTQEARSTVWEYLVPSTFHKHRRFSKAIASNITSSAQRPRYGTCVVVVLVYIHGSRGILHLSAKHVHPSSLQPIHNAYQGSVGNKTWVLVLSCSLECHP